MKNVRFSAAVAVVVAVAVAGMLATPVSADPVPQTKDYVGVGSATTQLSMNAVADGYFDYGFGFFATGYNATASARIASFDSVNPMTGQRGDLVVLRAGTLPIFRPYYTTGLGEPPPPLWSKNLLFGAANNTAVDFVRSSTALGGWEASAGLVAYPFAMEEVAAAVAPGSSYAPTSLSTQQLVGIYKGIYTNWNQVGGANAPITPLVPQSGSETRYFFESQLAATNDGSYVVYGANVIESVKEYDTSVFQTYPNAVMPFSVGRAGLTPGSVKFTNVGTASDGRAAFDAKHGVYNVVRGSQANKPWVASLFGPAGYLCSSSAKDAIASGGLTQLARPGAGVCGQPYVTTVGVTNFTTS